MKSKFISIIAVVMVLCGVLLGLFGNYPINHRDSSASPFSSPVIAYNGNITISPDGSISGLGSGTIPVVQSGNHYTLNGNVDGVINIQRNNSVFNGNGHEVINNTYSAGALLNLTSVNSITVENTFVNTSTAGGVLISNSNHIKVTNLTVSASIIGVGAGGNTTYVNLSDSKVSQNSNSVTSYTPVFFTYLYAFAPTSPSVVSGNNVIYNDTIIGSLSTTFGVFIQSNNTRLIDSTITMVDGSAAVGVFSNDTLVFGNTINATSYSAALYVANGQYNMTGNVLSDNFIDYTPNVNTGGSAIVTYSSGNISGNHIMTYVDGNSITGIDLYVNSTNVSGNTISFVNGSGSTSIQGISILASYENITSNAVYINGSNGIGVQFAAGDHENIIGNTFNINGSHATGFSEAVTSPRFVNVTHNSFIIYSPEPYGIEINGGSMNIEDNSFLITDNGSGTPDGIYNNVLSNTFGVIDITGNSIDMKTTSGPSSSITAISLSFNPLVQGVSIYGNSMILNSTNDDYGISLSNANASAIVDNTVTFLSTGIPNGIEVSGYTNSSISGNTILGTSTLIGDGFNIHNIQNDTLNNNTFNDLYDAIYPINSGNLTFVGNYFNDTSVAVILQQTNDTIFYHNDFTNYSSLPFQEVTSVGEVFNASYPIGGNYWDTYTGLDTNGDGIGDTSFTVWSPILDNYPLMKPWTRPQAIFTETGLLPGASWSVNFNGTTKTSTDSTISFNILNAAYQPYTFNIPGIAGYKGSNSGTFSYNGNSYTSKTVFTPYFTFNITESGLSSGTSWYVEVNGTQHQVNGTTYTTTALNGTTFTYSFENTSLYYTTAAPGSQTLQGSNVTVSVVYDHWAYISGVFNQTGINVTINGKTIGTGTTFFNETVPAGTYKVVISKPGYVTQYDNFTLNPGQSQNVSATLVTQSSGNSTTPGLSTNDYYYIGGGIAAVIVLIGMVSFLRRRH